MVALLGFPLVLSVYIALSDPTSLQRALSDPYFLPALRNTLLLVAIIIPLQFLLALSAALLLSKRFPGSSIFTFIFILPLLLSDISASLIWYNIFSYNGYLNRFLLKVGLVSKPLQLLGFQYQATEMLAIVVTEVWRATSLIFIIIFAGLQFIPKEYFEAADVFGASRLQKLVYVTLPLLKPSIQVALILRTLYALQIFAPMWVLTGRDVPVLAGEAYYWYTILLDPQVSTIYSLIIAAISVVFTAIYLRVTR
ncbi:carbohydrate ABC transporter permease [Infirmifilum sp. NZ]|uniref:carbohydrate ABC transporter permease n=1 Tax=Infirmifilum sp. NZ TaxID=2926850 RepID=UPI0027A93762|nr:sugar ABC transporter permease [Infirmifilum sp. NZ]UNQ73726.1 sugar ABC transporter permease [Infirmifilum sp. NZ]